MLTAANTLVKNQKSLTYTFNVLEIQKIENKL